jgi:hypothetical protein
MRRAYSSAARTVWSPPDQGLPIAHVAVVEGLGDCGMILPVLALTLRAAAGAFKVGKSAPHGGNASTI